MSNPPRRKGTAGERELLELLRVRWPRLRRTAASSSWDLEQLGDGEPVRVLAIRVDRGEWLCTVDLDSLLALAEGHEDVNVRIEVKRFARFALHTLWRKKWGGT